MRRAMSREIRRYLVGEGLRVQPGGAGGGFDLLAVLVRAGEEEHVVARPAV